MGALRAGAAATKGLSKPSGGRASALRLLCRRVVSWGWRVSFMNGAEPPPHCAFSLGYRGCGSCLNRQGAHCKVVLLRKTCMAVCLEGRPGNARATWMTVSQVMLELWQLDHTMEA